MKKTLRKWVEVSRRWSTGRKKKMISNPFAICLTAFPKAQRVGEMTQEVRVLVTKPCYLSSNTQGGERELPISCPLMAT